MKLNIIIYLLTICPLFSQVGIGINQPKSLLHIVSSDINSPSHKDGILIPKVNSFPQNPKSNAQLVFFEGSSEYIKGFYYWDGIDWNSFIVNQFDRNVDKAIYVITGVGYSGSGVVERNVLFNNIVANQLNNFSIQNNNIVVGKKGTYLVNFNSALKKSNAAYRATYTYKIKKNNSIELSSSSSIPNEAITASNISLSGIIDLNVGDIINVTIQKLDESHTDNSYTGYGTNTITLTYLKS